MENPFFMDPWNPVRRPSFPATRQRPSPSTKPKVVSIPVHFVGSDDRHKKPAITVPSPLPSDRIAAAVKIQKLYRGFIVRKSLRIVRKIAAEAEEIARLIDSDAESIRRDAKERLRLGEMLMALLLRLDSVRGVRDYRKKVIRRVISLQEAVDSISEESATAPANPASESPEDSETLSSVSDQVISSAPPPANLVSESPEDAETPECSDPVISKSAITMADQAPEKPEEAETLEIGETDASNQAIDEEEVDAETLEVGEPEVSDLVISESIEDEDAETLEVGIDEDEMDSMAGMETLETKPENEEPIVAADSIEPIAEAIKECLTEDLGVPKSILGALEASESVAELMEESPETQDLIPLESKGPANPEMKEMMARMATESERLNTLVAALCEQSAHQCRLIGGLVKRVDQLERSVQQMERKKKKKQQQRANTTALAYCRNKQ